MVEQNGSKTNKKIKRLSIITDILLLIPLIIATITVIKSVNIPKIEDTLSTEVLSLEFQGQNIEEENEVYIKKIKNEFGINVMYGKNVEVFAKRFDATALYDDYIINNNLKIVYKSLKKYPNQIFEMSISKENPIYIMLVDYFDNNNLALATRNNLDEYRIYLSNTEKLERAFHHEMYHVLEYYMTKDNFKLYHNWNSLNPVGFKYNEDTSKLTKEYVYDETNSNEVEYYFLTRYSKATEKEDRAEIFAELMILKKTPKYLDKKHNIRKKVDEIFSTIGENITFDDFYCSKYIKD